MSPLAESFFHEHEAVLTALASLLVSAILIFAVDRFIKRRGRDMRSALPIQIDPVTDTRLRFLRRLVEAGIAIIGVAVAVSQFATLGKLATSILALMLALSHKLLTKDTLTRTGRWAETTNHMGAGLTGRTVGSIGVGNIGGEVYRLLAPLEMQHIAYDPYMKAEDAAKLRVRMVDKDTVFRDADFVFVNTPLTAETRGSIGVREFSMMKPTAYFINTSRGPIVDEKALHAALAERRIAGAALDVFEAEPVAEDNPLLKLDNVIVTPHSICWTDEFFRNNAESAFRAVVAVSTGKTPTFVVNRDVLQNENVRMRLLDRPQ